MKNFGTAASKHQYWMLVEKFDTGIEVTSKGYLKKISGRTAIKYKMIPPYEKKIFWAQRGFGANSPGPNENFGFKNTSHENHFANSKIKTAKEN